MAEGTRVLIIALALAGPIGCSRSEPEISRASVERIVAVLSADEMQGRRAFTPAADRAAEFIRAEFAAIGLDRFGDLSGYRQPFPVYAITGNRATVELNGRTVPSERFAISVSSPALRWTDDDKVEIMVVGRDDDPMQALAVMRTPGTNTLVLMHRSHGRLFERVRAFTAGASRTLDPTSGSNTVLILTDETSASAFRIDVSASVEEEQLANVVGIIPGARRDEIVLFSAHYDHIGIRPPVDGDSIANGANDNASGTTAVIELARYFKALRKPGRTLVFVAFAAEEMGGYGSRYFASQLDLDQVVAMVNVEMIGKPAAAGPDVAWITGFDKSDLGEILRQAAAESGYTFTPDPYPDHNLFFRSDNATFARMGVPAHSISTTPIDVDEDYHRVSDELVTLDLDHMTTTVKAIARAAVAIVSGASTPTRIDPRDLE
ncbi:MAG: M20/M25/M40 family metallo-hydrolase [Gemmatimonadota bacterium]|nr:M20/M25/M40 family metallo-hydrolase [Gemmatimonadota bacterium]MDH3479123.1 M20/M25/M40 family metallo-hydrolase [Gemmatimonadota bacterium]MDH5551645.1 M20/M25/M40 family metallo-hydrolase [Gemmatimonadota bacterium]